MRMIIIQAMMMMMIRISFSNHILKICSFIFIFISANVSSPAQINDTKLWTGVTAKVPLTKNLSLSAEIQERLKNYFTNQDRFLVQAKVEYDFSDLFELGMGYRFTINNTRSYGYRNEYRTHVDLQIKEELRRFEFRVRNRLQYGNPEIIAMDYLSEELKNRNLFEMEYNIYRCPLTPKAGFELFYQLNNYKGNKIDQFRYILETDIRLGFSSTLNVFFYFEDELNVDSPEDSRIVGVNFKYDF